MSGEKINFFSVDKILTDLFSTSTELSDAHAEIVELSALLHPVLYKRDIDIASTEDNGLVADGGALFLKSAYLREGLQDCKRATLAAATIGPELPEYATLLAERGELRKAYLADLLGSLFVEAVAEEYYRYRRGGALPRGFFPTLRFSPGYGDWSLEDQPLIIEYLAAGEAIEVTAENMLLPIKSVTLLWGWSTHPQRAHYPVGDKKKSLCAGVVSCANCQTWACRKS